MKKRILSIILVFTLIFSMSVSAFGITDGITVLLEGEEFSLNKQAFINDEGKVMVPIRQIAEELDYIVEWNNDDRSVTLVKDDEAIEFKIGESNNLATMPILKDATTFVPLELLSKAMNLVVGWDGKYQLLKIGQPKENTEDIFNVSDEENIKNNLNIYLEALEESNNFFGSVLVAKEGKILHSDGYGFADVDQHTLNKSQTKFAIGSVTKQFVAMAIMQLSEQGLLDVEDTVAKYLPEFPNGELITLHNLLTHSSGLTNFTDLPEVYTTTETLSPTDILDHIKDMPLLFNPGEEFRYSNTNYLILGLIVEEVSGLSYEDYLRENIFEPLNMENTGILYGQENEIQDATAYSGDMEVEQIDDEMLLAIAYGAGSMYSTIEDLYRWEQALKTEKLVTSETLNNIFGKHVLVDEEIYYGYGWMISDTNIGKMIFHGGNTLGFTADVTRLTDLDLSIIILSNKGYVDFTNMKNNIISISLGGDYELPEAKEEIEIGDPTILDKYIGEYELFPEVMVTITREENRLFAQLTGQDKFEIYPSSETEFFYKVVDATITFVLDDEGNVSSLVLEQLGQEMPAIKIN